MKILGIDQSFTSCGIVVLVDGAMTSFTTISTKDMKDKDIHFRANFIAERVAEIINNEAPDKIAMEGLAFQQIGNATRDLAGLQFVLINKITYQMGHAIDIHTPLSVKKLATGSGKSKKEQMLEALPTNILDRFKQAGYVKTRGLTDLCDAYFIAKCSEQ
jgi:Holliday junction resolvasome RuvABC endonuclease subunit